MSKGKRKYIEKRKYIMIIFFVMLTLAGALTESRISAAQAKTSLSSKTLKLTVGQSKKLVMRGTKKKIKWSTSNKKVATVSSKGKVKAIKKGNAVITAKVSGKKYKCKVQVSKKKNENSQDNNTVTKEEEKNMIMQIDDTTVSVAWEDNKAVSELKEQLAQGNIVIDMSMYGGFEQVGSLGKSYTRADRQTTTAPGDIVLYSGNQMVVFYGSNSWSYTRLGKITGLSNKELTALLGKQDVTITLRLE